MYKQILEEAKAKYTQAQSALGEGKFDLAEGLLKEGDELKARATKAHELTTMSGEALSALDQFQLSQPEQVRSSGKFGEMRNFLFTVWKASNPRFASQARDARLHYFNDEPAAGHQKDMVESVGEDGGFLVPEEFRPQLMSVAAESGIVRSRATIIRMARRQVSMPVLDQTDTTAGQPHWFGGMQFYWADEAAEKTITQPDFKKVILTANKLIGYTVASDELVDDSALSLNDFLNSEMGFVGGVSWMEDHAFLNGSGVGKPLGVLNASATITVPRESVGAVVGINDLIKMRASLLPSASAVWVLNIGLMDELMKMTGPSGNASYLFIQNAREGIPDMLFGLPVIWSEKLPAPGSAGDALLADFKYYLLGDRQATTVESTKFDKWRYDETSWRVVHRVAGQPWLSSPLTLQDGVTQISPFVKLGAKTT